MGDLLIQTKPRQLSLCHLAQLEMLPPPTNRLRAGGAAQTTFQIISDSCCRGKTTAAAKGHCRNSSYPSLAGMAREKLLNENSIKNM